VDKRCHCYDMLNATISYRPTVSGGRSVELYARGTNLNNELAFAHTSFVKEQSPLRGRSLAGGFQHQF
jgi:iron complex outermembrane recepter protein